jgi:hypothetical protein
MTDYVPYTPKVIQLIRNGARATDLGWADSMYASVCRAHGLEPQHGADKPTVKPAPPPTIEGPVRYSSAAQEITRESQALALSRVQGRVFAVLLDRWRSGAQGFISTAAILSSIGATTSEKAMKENIARLSAKLTLLRMWIESKQGAMGGYRLRVDA